jgi:hypothetical protein
MKAEDCRPNKRVRVIANSTRAMKPDGSDYLQPGDLIELIPDPSNPKEALFVLQNGMLCVFFRREMRSQLIPISEIEPV